MTTIRWAGYKWTLTPHDNSPAPDGCYFDDLSTWKFTRGGGLLLRTIYDPDDHVWRCVELSGPELGYGRYEWEILTDPAEWDANIYLGLFTYAGVQSGYNEIDIKFSKQGDVSAKNIIHFANQPTAEVLGGTSEIHESHHGCGNSRGELPLTVTMVWQPGQIYWRVTDKRGVIFGEHFCPDGVPVPTTTPAPNVHMNFLYQGTGSPAGGRVDSIELKSFHFRPSEVRQPPPAAQPSFIIPASTVDTFPAFPQPTAFTMPRQVDAVIKPTRLNLCPNPSADLSIDGWTAIGSASLSRDTATTLDAASLKVTVSANDDGAYIVLPDLIVGDTYVASAQVQGGPGLLDIILGCAGVSATSAEHGIPYGGDAIDGIGYGQGPYGGLAATGSDMTTGTWFTPSLVFTAQQSTEVLSVRALTAADVSFPAEFWVDQVLVEAGEVVGTYFDGWFGADYSWETSGTAGLTRSYYYQRQAVASGAVDDVLEEHTPLGIAAAEPVYSQPATQ